MQASAVPQDPAPNSATMPVTILLPRFVLRFLDVRSLAVRFLTVRFLAARSLDVRVLRRFCTLFYGRATGANSSADAQERQEKRREREEERGGERRSVFFFWQCYLALLVLYERGVGDHGCVVGAELYTRAEEGEVVLFGYAFQLCVEGSVAGDASCDGEGCKL